MDALRAKDQFGKRQVEQRADLGPRPVVAGSGKTRDSRGIGSRGHAPSVAWIGAPVKSAPWIGLAGSHRSYHNGAMMKLRSTNHFVFVAVLAAIGLARPALAQDEWPTRPVLVVSPFSAGSANDIVARLVFDQIGQQVGQAFVVENRPGGGGIVGVASVVRAEPDGYTLLLSSASMILHRSLPYDELRDLEPIAMLGAQPSVLVAAPGKGFATVADLVAAAKSRP